MNQNEWFWEDPLSMETSDRSFSDFVDVLKSWMSRRSEPANLSRDFWMPDDSCRVCYDCDSQFTVFNRRHHCRHCGRVFCAKCTSNFVPHSSVDPKSSREEGERVRVCNYCFKQWEEDVIVARNGTQPSTVVLSPSLSTTSLASTKSSGTGNSSTTTAGSVSCSSGTCQNVQYGSIPSPSASPGPCLDKQDIPVMERNMESMVNERDPSNHFGFCLNRSSDDDDDDYGGCHSYSEAQNCQNSDDYYGSVEFDNEVVYQSDKLHPVEGNKDDKDTFSFANDKTKFSSLSSDKMEERNVDNGDECDASSSIYGRECIDAEPVDFENNGLLWLPPEPEDEEDDREGALFDDDDDDATGEWGYLRSSNSFGRGENRNRDRSAEEHKKAMKNIVDGHFRALVSQLLQAENLFTVEENGKESWLDIITSLSWEAASILKPDTSKGGGMDPGGYVKVKCLACGRPSDSVVVKGVVCKKNVAHRRMSSKIEKPRFLILEGALEYQRISNLLSSFDTLLQQEMDYLKMAVAKIQAHQPNVLLVEKTVSRHAQELFLDKNISLVLNIKRPLLERISRCTGAQMVPSIDHLSSQKLGCCDLFHVEKFLEDRGSAGQDGKKMLKTLMFFEGCPKPLGCTILLKGANGDELKKVKHVMQYGVFAAYHLALETSFLADEGATLPELPLKTPITVALPNKPSNFDRSISLIPGFTVPSSGMPLSNSVQAPNMPGINKASNDFKKTELMISPCSAKNSNCPALNFASTFVAPLESSPSRYTQNEYAVCALGRIPLPSLSSSDVHTGSGLGIRTDDRAVAEGCEITCNYADESIESLEIGHLLAHNSEMDNKKVMEKQSGFFNLETLHHDNNIRDEYAFPKEDFLQSPSDHQSILVSLSSRCVWKGTVCERAHLFRIKYYSSFDKPLGRFLRDHLFDQSYRCRSCEMPSEAHIHCYTHRQGSLTISVRKLPELILPGERDGKIWMWHRCLCCPRVKGFPPATRRVVMSDAAWGLSFGKFLELSFSNHAAASRVASCGHSLHRDCLRFYGFGRMVACFRYAAISVHSVYLPPAKLDFSHQYQEWVEKEAKEVADTAKLLFTEVQSALQQISERKLNTGSVVGNVKIQDPRRNVTELEGMLQVEKADFMESLQKLMRRETKKGQPPIDILEVNKLRRQLLFLSYLWDQRLVFAAGSHNSSQEVLGSFPVRNEEKLESAGASNLSIRSEKSSGNFEALSNSGVDELLNPSLIPSEVEVYDHPNQSNVIHSSNSTGKDGSNEVKNKIYHVTSANVNDQLNPLESGLGVRKVLSDGQFPSIADLSDTLDAKWRGENSSSLADINMPKPLASVEVAAAASLSGDTEERSKVDLIPIFVSALPAKWGETVEELSSWIKMPFSIFYHSFNKNTGSAPRFDALSDYNPVYVSVFRDLARQGGARLFLPIGVNGTVIPVFDDEPTSIISYVLVSPCYHFKTSDDGERPKAGAEFSLPLPVYDSGNFHPLQLIDDISSETFRSLGSTDDNASSISGSRISFALDPLISTKEMHVRVSFADDGSLGKVKYTVTCYYAKCFEALRKTCCPSELDFIRSLSRCKKWGAQGGKSNVFFAKSVDDRFIIKQVTKTELESFIKFAPEYFKYLSESISTGSPTCLAKILGIYQVSKQIKGGKESRMDLLVMENLMFGRNVTRLYDLKGSSRSRYNPDSSGNNKVLLDQNLIEAMPTSPIFVGNKAKRLLERAVWNDTSFLASIDVMDYSLLVGVDEEKHELVLGIIDFMRQYTWDKHLETWVKASGILGGPKNASPTVISPKQYKKRFRKAMSAYFLVVPDQWSPPTIIPSKSQSDLCQENLQGASQES